MRIPLLFLLGLVSFAMTTLAETSQGGGSPTNTCVVSEKPPANYQGPWCTTDPFLPTFSEGVSGKVKWKLNPNFGTVGCLAKLDSLDGQGQFTGGFDVAVTEELLAALNIADSPKGATSLTTTWSYQCVSTSRGESVWRVTEKVSQWRGQGEAPCYFMKRTKRCMVHTEDSHYFLKEHWREWLKTSTYPETRLVMWKDSYKQIHGPTFRRSVDPANINRRYVSYVTDGSYVVEAVNSVDGVSLLQPKHESRERQEFFGIYFVTKDNSTEGESIPDWPDPQQKVVSVWPIRDFLNLRDDTLIPAMDLNENPPYRAVSRTYQHSAKFDPPGRAYHPTFEGQYKEGSLSPIVLNLDLSFPEKSDPRGLATLLDKADAMITPIKEKGLEGPLDLDKLRKFLFRTFKVCEKAAVSNTTAGCEK